MSITAADLLWKYSVVAAAGNTTAGTAVASLGDQISTTVIPDNVLSNLFDVITAAENLASDVEYRCIFIHNNHATLSGFAGVVWIQAEVAGGATLAISVDTTGVTDKNDAFAQAKQVIDEQTAPAGQVFSSPISQATGLALPTIPAGGVCAVWVRRTAHNTASVPADGGTLRVSVETA